ncbi:PREDICTED: NDR1/HIN1-like protein 12 [Camelina sativa]|uniref:NDR1/HIN1-like protein 12 n=1 Tax=Camelina sativa TaxID=90675 RepID=A0ABM1RPX8_CAMSA|nr:PREDICTED: NDR1/HIN1-like protein 12 [Camelina sativa]
MTIKECSLTSSRKILPIIKFLFVTLLLIFFGILTAIFLVWVILQPSKPCFILQDATVFNFNVSRNPVNLLNSTFNITLSSQNPNDKIGIYYDRLNVYASYMSQQITLRTSIPPTYQGHKEVNVWSSIVAGNFIPVAPDIALHLDQDQTTGAIMLMLHLDGQIRWKFGTLITGKYHLRAMCPAYIKVWKSAAGVIVGKNAVEYRLIRTCMYEEE